MSDLTDPKQWENAEIEWGEKSYYSVPLTVFFGKPQKLFESVQRIRAEIASKDYNIKPDAMLLIEIESFKGRLLVEIVRPQEYDASVVDMEKSKLVTAVHNGPFKTIKQTAKKLQEHVLSTKGIPATSTYYWDFRHGSDLTGQRADRFVVLCRV